MLDDVHFVLSHTTHPGNIGAAARALKTMGLSHLSLVNPKTFPCAEATQRASGAQDVLSQAKVFDSIESALSPYKLIIGTSARNRTLPWPMIEPRELAEMIAKEPKRLPVAIVFGTENSGMTNAEMQLCHYHVNIPTNPDYSSLNVASAVQLIAYEMRLAHLNKLGKKVQDEVLEESEQPARAEQVEQMFDHMMQAMTATDFFNPAKPKLIQMRLRRIFNKSDLTQSEVQLLRGFLASVTKYKSGT